MNKTREQQHQEWLFKERTCATDVEIVTKDDGSGVVMVRHKKVNPEHWIALYEFDSKEKLEKLVKDSEDYLKNVIRMARVLFGRKVV